MPQIHTNDLSLAREEGHSADFYGSFLQPTTLWAAQVNGAHSRGETTITFDSGTGSAFSAVQAWQTIWVGTSAGDKDVGITRVRSISSGDGGVTGTLEVAPNWFPWVNNMYITMLHDYRLQPMYPYINPSTEVFYKDGDVAWSDQNIDLAPVVIAEFDARSKFIRNGEAVFWIDASNSYAMKPGETISTYALSVYPATGVTVTFNTSTGIGRIVCTDDTIGAYWAKFTVTDSNAESQISFRCFFAHSTDPSDSTYPHIDFNLNQANGQFDRGGYYAQIAVNDETTFAEMPENTFCTIWRESIYGLGNSLASVIRDPTLGDIEYFNPVVGYTMVPNGPNWDVTVTFTAGVLEQGSPAANGTAVDVDITLNGGTPQNKAGTTSGGTITLAHTFTSEPGDGTILVEDSANSRTVVSDSYKQGNIVSVTGEWPSTLRAYPQHLIIGYLRKENVQQSYAPRGGHGTVSYDITTIEGLLKNQFMFSVSLASRPNGEVNKWYEILKDLSIGIAAWHIWKWHSSLFEVADVLNLRDNTDGRAYAEFEGGSLYTMPDNMARNHGIRAHVVCNQMGQLSLSQDIQLLTDSERSALTTIATIEKEDRSAEMGILHNDEDETAFVYVSGLYFGGTYAPNESGEQAPNVEPYCATAPGAVPSGSGENAIHLERQVLRSQQHCNEIAGRVYGQVNNPYPEVRIKFHGDYWNLLDVSLEEFWQIDVALDDTIRNIYWLNKNLILRETSLVYSVEKGTVQVNATFEPEADAYPGVSAPCFGNMPVIAGTPVLPVLGTFLAGTIVTSSD
jgi:hypothetical protein